MSRWQLVGALLASVLVAGWIALATFAIVQSFQFDDAQSRYDELVARERTENTVRACLERGRQNDGIVAYLRDLGATADDVQQARAFFPKLTRQQCEQAAAESISKP